MSRRYDPPETAARYDRLRVLRTVGGIIVTFGGCAVAFKYPEHTQFGLIVALVGAGAIDYAAILRKLLKNGE